MTRHIVLLGDSIFDNALYVPGGPSVIEHLRRALPKSDKATLIALDGATVTSVFRQLERIPQDATHIVLSAGGNDALWMAGNIFSQPTTDIRSSLQLVAQAVTEFRLQYRKLVSELRALRLRLTVCTIYDAVPGLDSSEIAGLCVFNDTITRTAFENGATLVDLRVICNETTDYSTISPIEPSASGGGKIARAIVEATSEGQFFHRVIG
ncbi:MAG: SGNH/GDSL hydrolase family protein [Pirellulaceae bacterium]|nr:SGNH/GDSL hydrolase family protein [Pirellulaceae bacterium]